MTTTTLFHIPMYNNRPFTPLFTMLLLLMFFAIILLRFCVCVIYVHVTEWELVQMVWWFVVLYAVVFSPTLLVRCFATWHVWRQWTCSQSVSDLYGVILCFSLSGPHHSSSQDHTGTYRHTAWVVAQEQTLSGWIKTKVKLCCVCHELITNYTLLTLVKRCPPVTGGMVSTYLTETKRTEDEETVTGEKKIKGKGGWGEKTQ